MDNALLAGEAAKRQLIFDELHGTLSTQNGEIAALAKELRKVKIDIKKTEVRERFQIHLGRLVVIDALDHAGSDSTVYLWIYLLGVGHQLPSTEILFEHMKIDAEAYVGVRVPTIFNFMVNIL
ncbi:hypothetical protein QVD17_19606 [Tagetes erecta]|uniref:Uncharacterized protein n=1 Tax=Tagetes erecta TaxID=13708 RepID=A0AAD8KMZ5_TARER|nr:hypothetical protein QVD17_19606 [Tagetes erecta]